MKLPFLKLQKDTPEKNFFLSLLIKPYKVGAILFEEINEKLFILATKEVEVTKTLEEVSPEDLLTASDSSISAVEASLPEGGTVEKTIFSVPYTWITDGKIDKEHLEKLKKVCDALGLVPMGYLTSIEAIVSFLNYKEGVPVSAVFIEVSKKLVSVYLVRAGKILEHHEAEVEDKLLSTVDKLFAKIHSVDVLPSKIVLLDHAGAENSQQEFLSHTFPKDIPFLHLPQVMVLESGFENEAIVNGVATQMELEVLNDVKTTDAPIDEGERLEKADAEEFGFMKEKDVAKEKVEEKTPESEPAESEDEKGDKTIKRKNGEPNVTYFREDDEDEHKKIEVKSSESLPHQSASLPILASIPELASLIRKIKIPDFKNIPVLASIPGGSSKPKIIAGIAAVVILIFLLSLAYYNIILGAQVSVFLDKKAIDKTADVTFAENPTSDNAIKVTLISEEVKGDDSKNSTGKKETGEKATGTVTIYNKTEDPKAFTKGTILVGPNSLEFELTDSVNVASTSSFATTLSNVKAKVEAAKFGKEYNLPSATNFTVKGFSTSQFIGKNDSALSGGTKKETTVVSEKDLQGLLVSVTDKLEKEAVEKGKQGLSPDDQLLSTALSSEVKDRTFSKKAGDEAGSVGVSATIAYSLGRYSKQDLQRVVDSLSAGEIPGSYSLEASSSKIEVTDIKVSKDNKATAKLRVNAIYTPKIENAKLASDIKGKTKNSAIEKIKSITGVTDVVVNLRRVFPLFPQLLPFNPKNISVEVKN